MFYPFVNLCGFPLSTAPFVIGGFLSELPFLAGRAGAVCGRICLQKNVAGSFAVLWGCTMG